MSDINTVNASVTGTLTANLTKVVVYGTVDTSPAAAEIGSTVSLARFTHGHHLDSLTRANGSGRTLYLNYYANAGVRIGNTTGGKLSINCAESNYHLDVVGAGRFSGALVASNFPSTSDARLKTEVEPASLDECTRLVLAVRPKTYNRIDMGGTPRLGYIAQDFSQELSGGYRCIMGESADESGPLPALDYSRIVPVLHGALLSALARISALESRT